MTSCQQARMLTWATRALAVAATGAVSWYVALPLAQHFAVELTDAMRIGIGCLFAVTAFFVSKRALDFTEDCMTVPDSVASAAHGNSPQRRVTCRKKSCQFYAPEGDKSPADGSATGSACGFDAREKPAQSLSATVADSENVKVELQTVDQVTTVTVTISGVSAARFKDKQNGLRKRLESVGGIKWDNPKNLGNGSRQMVGKITSAANRESIVARLQEIASGK